MEELTERKNEMLKGEQGSREERGVGGWVRGGNRVLVGKLDNHNAPLS